MKVLRGLIFNNLGLKGISLGLALLVWFQVAGQQTFQQKLSLPIQFVNIPPQTEISNDYEKQVEVVIRSGRSTPSSVDEDLAVVIDLRDATPGPEKLYSLSEENIQDKPSGVEIVSITPNRIRLWLENTVQKSIEVVPELEGELAEGFEVTKVQAPPVVISGPQSRVEKVSEAQTEPISIEGLSSTLVRNASVDIDDLALRIDSATVAVVVTIEEKRQEVRVRRILIELLPENVEASLMTRRADLVGTVPLSFEGDLTATDFRATVNVEALEPRQESYEVIPKITVSEQYAGIFRLESVLPESVKVRRIR
ncbi:MAG: CdaR family protein [Acidobacteria bacterium]|nr:CdaR family protein [Acidobacteriota bacterium]